jgi:hypothetical protein
MSAELIDLVIAAMGGGIGSSLIKPALAPVEALSEHWRDKVRARLQSTGARTKRKLGETPGIHEIGDRTLVKALEEASLTDDAVVQEYLAGVIASCRAVEDDSGTAVVGQIERLSSLEIKLHYLIYRELWRLEEQSRHRLAWDLRDPSFLARAGEVYIPAINLEQALDFDLDPSGVDRVTTALYGLGRERLLVDRGALTYVLGPLANSAFMLDSASNLKTLRNREFPLGGLICRPTPQGIELFLRGCGHSDRSPIGLRTLPRGLTEFDPEIPWCSDSALVIDLPVLG